MVDNVQKGGVPSGDAMPSGNGENKNNVLQKTVRKLGAMAMIAVSSISLLVGCGNKEEAPKEENTATEAPDITPSAAVSQAPDFMESLGNYYNPYEDELSESNYDDENNYDHSDVFDLNDLQRQIQDKTCIGITGNGIKYNLMKTAERTLKTLEKHPGYKILPFGGDLNEFAKNNDTDGLRTAFLDIMDDQPHVLAASASFLLTNQEKTDLGFMEGIDQPNEMYQQLLAVRDGADFQQAVYSKVAEKLGNAKISFSTFTGDCDSFGVSYKDKAAGVNPDNLTINKVHHTGDTFMIVVVECEDGTTVYFKVNCVQPVDVVQEKKVTSKPEPTKVIVTNKPTPTTVEPTPTTVEKKITSEPKPSLIITPIVTNKPTHIPTATPTEEPKPSIIPSEEPKPSIIPSEEPKPSIIPSEEPKPSTTPSATPSLAPKDTQNNDNINQQIGKNIGDTYGSGNVTIDQNNNSDADKEDPTGKHNKDEYDGGATGFEPSKNPQYEGNNTGNGNNNGINNDSNNGAIPVQGPSQTEGNGTGANNGTDNGSNNSGNNGGNNENNENNGGNNSGNNEASPTPTAILITPDAKNDFSANNPSPAAKQEEDKGDNGANGNNTDNNSGDNSGNNGDNGNSDNSGNNSEQGNTGNEPTPTAYLPNKDNTDAQNQYDQNQAGRENKTNPEDVTDDDLAGSNF